MSNASLAQLAFKLKLFVLSLSSFLLFANAALTGTAQGSYANNCQTCILNGFDFCTSASTMITASGVCCSGLVQYGDYCSASNLYCTSQSIGGTKYFWCGRDSTANCGSHTLYVALATTMQIVSQGSYKTCEFTFSTTDAAQAKTAATQVQAYMNSDGQFEVISTNTDAQMAIYVIDRNLKATQYKVGQLGKINFYDILVVSTITAASVSYKVAYGVDVATSLGQSNATSSNSIMLKVTSTTTTIAGALFLLTLLI